MNQLSTITTLSSGFRNWKPTGLQYLGSQPPGYTFIKLETLGAKAHGREVRVKHRTFKCLEG